MGKKYVTRVTKLSDDNLIMLLLPEAVTENALSEQLFVKPCCLVNVPAVYVTKILEKYL